MPASSRPSSALPLLAVPNVSEGRNAATLRAIGAAFTAQAALRLLDVHADEDHHRAVLTLGATGGRPAQGQAQGPAQALLEGVAEAVRLIDLSAAVEPPGQHPHVGAVDVLPIVYLQERMRGEACAQALLVADRIGEELQVPVFMYGELADGRTRAQLRRGGLQGLTARMAAGEQRPDFGPRRPHPTAGVTLVAAREPLVAFNLELAPPARLQDARGIAAAIREGGEEGLPGLRAIGVALRGGAVAQVSMNVERPLQVPLARVVQAVARRAPLAAAEIVGLAPRAALEGFPEELAIRGFDPARQLIENALGL
jgi:glutamate formiminotransferase